MEKAIHQRLKSLKSIWSKQGKSAAIFNLKERVLGTKKSGMEAVAILNPDSGDLSSTPEDIKKVSLEYYVKLLTNREPRGMFQEILKRKVSLHQERMKEIVYNDLGDLPFSDFLNALKKVATTHREKY